MALLFNRLDFFGAVSARLAHVIGKASNPCNEKDGEDLQGVGGCKGENFIAGDHLGDRSFESENRIPVLNLVTIKQAWPGDRQEPDRRRMRQNSACQSVLCSLVH